MKNLPFDPNKTAGDIAKFQELATQVAALTKQSEQAHQSIQSLELRLRNARDKWQYTPKREELAQINEWFLGQYELLQLLFQLMEHEDPELKESIKLVPQSLDQNGQLITLRGFITQIVENLQSHFPILTQQMAAQIVAFYIEELGVISNQLNRKTTNAVVHLQHWFKQNYSVTVQSDVDVKMETRRAIWPKLQGLTIVYASYFHDRLVAELNEGTSVEIHQSLSNLGMLFYQTVHESKTNELIIDASLLAKTIWSESEIQNLIASLNHYIKGSVPANNYFVQHLAKFRQQLYEPTEVDPGSIAYYLHAIVQSDQETGIHIQTNQALINKRIQLLQLPVITQLGVLVNYIEPEDPTKWESYSQSCSETCYLLKAELKKRKIDATEVFMLIDDVGAIAAAGLNGSSKLDSWLARSSNKAKKIPMRLLMIEMLRILEDPNLLNDRAMVSAVRSGAFLDYELTQIMAQRNDTRTTRTVGINEPIVDQIGEIQTALGTASNNLVDINAQITKLMTEQSQIFKIIGFKPFEILFNIVKAQEENPTLSSDTLENTLNFLANQSIAENSSETFVGIAPVLAICLEQVFARKTEVEKLIRVLSILQKSTDLMKRLKKEVPTASEEEVEVIEFLGLNKLTADHRNHIKSLVANFEKELAQLNGLLGNFNSQNLQEMPPKLVTWVIKYTIYQKVYGAEIDPTTVTDALNHLL